MLLIGHMGVGTGGGGPARGDGHAELAGGSEPPCCWNAAASLHTAESAADGRMAFPGLASGDYMLAETRTHPNFELPSGQWMMRPDVPPDTFDIKARGDLPPAFRTEGEDDAAVLVPNYHQAGCTTEQNRTTCFGSSTEAEQPDIRRTHIYPLLKTGISQDRISQE